MLPYYIRYYRDIFQQYGRVGVGVPPARAFPAFRAAPAESRTIINMSRLALALAFALALTLSLRRCRACPRYRLSCAAPTEFVRAAAAGLGSSARNLRARTDETKTHGVVTAGSQIYFSMEPKRMCTKNFLIMQQRADTCTHKYTHSIVMETRELGGETLRKSAWTIIIILNIGIESYSRKASLFLFGALARFIRSQEPTSFVFICPDVHMRNCLAQATTYSAMIRMRIATRN